MLKKTVKFHYSQTVDLILMDIQMPVMDGITATRILKEKYIDLPPIVGLSANAFEGDREKYMNLGMDKYLTKPVSEGELTQVISQLRG
jgi:CheY-like chemotaxis protein